MPTSPPTLAQQNFAGLGLGVSGGGGAGAAVANVPLLTLLKATHLTFVNAGSSDTTSNSVAVDGIEVGDLILSAYGLVEDTGSSALIQSLALTDLTAAATGLYIHSNGNLRTGTDRKNMTWVIHWVDLT